MWNWLKFLFCFLISSVSLSYFTFGFHFCISIEFYFQIQQNNVLFSCNNIIYGLSHIPVVSKRAWHHWPIKAESWYNCFNPVINMSVERVWCGCAWECLTVCIITLYRGIGIRIKFLEPLSLYRYRLPREWLFYFLQWENYSLVHMNRYFIYLSVSWSLLLWSFVEEGFIQG